MHTMIQSISSDRRARASSCSRNARCAPELYPLMYGLSPLATYTGTWSRRKALNPPSCTQTSSLLREITRIEPTVKAYQLPRKSGEWLSGSSNLVWYDRYPWGPFPTSFSWLPAAGIHGLFAADRVLLVKNDVHVATGSSLTFA